MQYGYDMLGQLKTCLTKMEVSRSLRAEDARYTTQVSGQRQVELKIAAGFHRLLGQTEREYRATCQQLVEMALASPFPTDGILALVETRILFFTQLEFLGITRDPAVFLTPLPDGETPYYVWMKIVGRGDEMARKGLSTSEMIRNLPPDLRPANPFEGIANFAQVLGQSFVNLPGGRLKKPLGITGCASAVRSLCLDRFFGQPRITHTYLNEFDGLVGLLAVQR